MGWVGLELIGVYFAWVGIGVFYFVGGGFLLYKVYIYIRFRSRVLGRQQERVFCRRWYIYIFDPIDYTTTACGV
jgi:hypothetical protein